MFSIFGVVTTFGVMGTTPVVTYFLLVAFLLLLLFMTSLGVVHGTASTVERIVYRRSWGDIFKTGPYMLIVTSEVADIY